MEGDERLKEINSELDNLSIQSLKLMKEYIDLKLDLEDLIKSGSINLAKSRYIMGNRSVSSLQIPSEDSEISAGVKVKRDELNDCIMELNRLGLEEKNVTDGPRLRRKIDDKEPEKEDVKTKPTIQDPIKWFGVLVPQNLRLAQAEFFKALETSVQCANVQIEMSKLQDRYKTLIIEKKSLLTNS